MEYKNRFLSFELKVKKIMEKFFIEKGVVTVFTVLASWKTSIDKKSETEINQKSF